MKLADVKHRVMATIVDKVVLFFVLSIMFLGIWPKVVYYYVNDIAFTAGLITGFIFSIMLYTFILLSYYVILPMFLKGQTIGKKLFNIKIVKDDENELTYSELFLREGVCRVFIRTLSFGLSFIVSFIIMCIRKDKKGIADIFAKTKVIDIKGDKV